MIQYLLIIGIKIAKIGITNDKISDRGGLILFLNYFEKKGGYTLLFSVISEKINSNKKGLQLNELIKQIIAFFMDGTDCTMLSFDYKKEDKSDTVLLDNKKTQMATSHQIKNIFFKIINYFDHIAY